VQKPLRFECKQCLWVEKSSNCSVVQPFSTQYHKQREMNTWFVFVCPFLVLASGEKVEGNSLLAKITSIPEVPKQNAQPETEEARKVKNKNAVGQYGFGGYEDDDFL
jgi:hypothetical protein